jgi:hypothetical protein
MKRNRYDSSHIHFDNIIFGSGDISEHDLSVESALSRERKKVHNK